MKNYRGYLKKEYNRIFNSSKKDLINNNIDIDNLDCDSNNSN